MTGIEMSKVFDLPVNSDFDTISDRNNRDLATFDTCKEDEAAVHAINQHDKLVELNKELVEALLAAVTYINESPCDPNIYPEQLEAWNKYKSIEIGKLILKAKELQND